MRQSWVSVVAALLIIVGYVVPWVVTPNASLTFGGYDLAEWASLHYATRGEIPPLLTSFLLRLPLALAAVLIGWANVNASYLRAGIVVVIAAALLPPLEIIQFPNDVNYQQQALIAGIALVGGLTGIAVGGRFGALIPASVGIVGIGAVIGGLTSAYGLLRGFTLPVTLGAGGVIVIAAFALNSAAALRDLATRQDAHKRQGRGAPRPSEPV